MFESCTYPGCPRAGVFDSPGCCWEHCKEVADLHEHANAAKKKHMRIRNILERLQRNDKDVVGTAREIQALTGGPIEIALNMVTSYPKELKTLMAGREKIAAEGLQLANEGYSCALERLRDLQDVAMVSTEKRVSRLVSSLATDKLYRPGGPMYKRAMSSYENLLQPTGSR